MSLPSMASSLQAVDFEIARLLFINGFKRLRKSIMGRRESLNDVDLRSYYGLLQTVCGFVNKQCFVKKSLAKKLKKIFC